MHMQVGNYSVKRRFKGPGERGQMDLFLGVIQTAKDNCKQMLKPSS